MATKNTPAKKSPAKPANKVEPKKVDKVEPVAKVEPAKVAKAEPAERDALGCRVGSQAAVINSHVTAKPQLASAIAAACGLPHGRVYSHLRSLVAKGHAVHGEQGYSLAKAPAKAPATAKAKAPAKASK